MTLLKKILLLFIYNWKWTGIFSITILFFSSCVSTRIDGKLKSNYPANDPDAPVILYQNPKEIPVKSEFLGTLKARCADLPFTKTKMDSASIMDLLRTRARVAGGNALLLTKIKNRTKYNKNIEINTEVMRVHDFTSPPDTLWLNRRPKKIAPPEKGTWDVRISLPWAHKFLFHPEGENHKDGGGFLGMGIGADYYLRKTHYLSLHVAAIMDNPVPAPMGVNQSNYMEETQHFHSIYTTLTHNHWIRCFSVGYGLSLSRNTWRYSDDRIYPDYCFDPEGQKCINDCYWKYGPRKSSSRTVLGLSLSTHYHPIRNFGVGITYQPGLLRLHNSKPWSYEHTLSLGILWTIRLKSTSIPIL